MLVLLATAADNAELIDACGQPGQQSWLCSTVYDVTGSASASRVADDLSKPFRIVLILLIAYILVRLSRLVIRRIVKRLARDDAAQRISRIRHATGIALLDTSPVPNVRRALRAETIGAILRSIVAAMIWATSFVMILDTIAVNLAAIGIGASIVGVAVGFGSQSLVKDFVSGIFMIVEDQYGVGDVIDTGEAAGVVEGVSLRTTRLRDVEGVVWHVPNGEIRKVGNKSQQWSRALLDVAIAYDSDIDAATAAIREAAQSVAADPEFRDLVIDDPEVLGVEQVTARQIVIRLMVKTKPLEQWTVARALRPRVKAALDAAGVVPIDSNLIAYRTDGGVPEPDQ